MSSYAEFHEQQQKQCIPSRHIGYVGAIFSAKTISSDGQVLNLAALDAAENTCTLHLGSRQTKGGTSQRIALFRDKTLDKWYSWNYWTTISADFPEDLLPCDDRLIISVKKAGLGYAPLDNEPTVWHLVSARFTYQSAVVTNVPPVITDDLPQNFRTAVWRTNSYIGTLEFYADSVHYPVESRTERDCRGLLRLPPTILQSVSQIEIPEGGSTQGAT